MDPSFGKYAGAMANFALIRVETVNILKETGGSLLLKLIQINTESIKMNNSCALSEFFCGGLKFGSL